MQTFSWNPCTYAACGQNDTRHHFLLLTLSDSAALQQRHFFLQLLQSRFVLYHLSQYTFYVGLRFGGHSFGGTVVGPRRLGLCELDSVFGFRSERANFVSQLMIGLRVLGLEVIQFGREHVVCLVGPEIVSLPSTEHSEENSYPL